MYVLLCWTVSALTRVLFLVFISLVKLFKILWIVFLHVLEDAHHHVMSVCYFTYSLMFLCEIVFSSFSWNQITK